MTKVEQIERQIQELSHAEFEELREWIIERDWEAWDRQVEQDVRAGKLDELVRESKTLFDLRDSVKVEGPQDFDSIREFVAREIASRNARSLKDYDG